MQPRGERLSYKRCSNHLGAEHGGSVVVTDVPSTGAATGGRILKMPAAPGSVLSKEPGGRGADPHSQPFRWTRNQGDRKRAAG